MHSSGSGKALLAHYPPERLAHLIESHGLPAATEKTIVTPQALRHNLDQARVRGFAVDDEEAAHGIRCVAAPIFDHTGEVIAAISISGPASRIIDERIASLGERVHTGARSLSRLIGGNP